MAIQVCGHLLKETSCSEWNQFNRQDLFAATLFFLCFLPVRMWGAFLFLILPPCHIMGWRWPIMRWTYWAKINLLSFKFQILGILSQWWENWFIQKIETKKRVVAETVVYHVNLKPLELICGRRLERFWEVGCKQSLVGDSGKSSEDQNSYRNMGSKGQAQVSVGNKDSIDCWTSVHVCCTTAENLSRFYPCPETLWETELREGDWSSGGNEGRIMFRLGTCF